MKGTCASSTVATHPRIGRTAGLLGLALLVLLAAPATASAVPSLNCLRPGTAFKSGGSDRAWIVKIVCDMHLINGEQNKHTALLKGHTKRLDAQAGTMATLSSALKALTARVASIEGALLPARVATAEGSINHLASRASASSFAADERSSDLAIAIGDTQVLSLTSATSAGGAIATASSARVMASASIRLVGPSTVVSTVSCRLQSAPGAFPDAWVDMSTRAAVTFSDAQSMAGASMQLALVGHKDRAAGTTIVRVVCSSTAGGWYRSGNLDVWSVAL